MRCKCARVQVHYLQSEEITVFLKKAKQGCIKLNILPPPRRGGKVSSWVGKKIKSGRREGERGKRKGKAREKAEGKAREKGREREEGKTEG